MSILSALIRWWRANTILCAAWLFVGPSVCAQSIYRNWASADGTICLGLNDKGWSKLDELKYVKVRIREGQLILYDYWNHKALFGGREKHIFRIIELTDDTLVLERVSTRTFDYIPWGIHSFKPAGKGQCEILLPE